MALKCGPNKFSVGVGGGAINANVVIAIAQAHAKFVAALKKSLLQAQQFVNQKCPENCPKKTVVGPAVSKPKFSLRFNAARKTWQASYTCIVTATVKCA